MASGFSDGNCLPLARRTKLVQAPTREGPWNFRLEQLSTLHQLPEVVDECT